MGSQMISHSELKDAGQNGSLPYSADAEKGLLSAYLQDPPGVAELCRHSNMYDAFYAPAHRIVYETISELVGSGTGVDFVTVTQVLNDRAKLDEVGGREFINELLTFVPTPAIAKYYVEIVLEKAQLRKLILSCNQLATMATDTTASSTELLEKAEAEIAEIKGASNGTSDSSEEMTVGELLEFNREKDERSVLGNRWQTRGDSLLISGPTGIGKSSFATQAVITWCLGRSLFGISTAGKLRVLVIESENNRGDLAIAFQDCCDRMKLTDSEIMELKERLTFVRQCSLTGPAFVHELRRLIRKHRPDIVLIDPLFSYLGGDASSQEVMSKFLRNQLQPILNETGVILVVIHHTSKPPKDAVNTPNEGFAHRSFGSVELLNWAREIVTFVPRKWDQRIFSLEFRKRSRQAGISDLNGQPTYELFLKHSTDGVVWESCNQDDIQELTEKPGGRPTKYRVDDLIKCLGARNLSTKEFFKRVAAELGISRAMFYRLLGKGRQDGRLHQCATDETWETVSKSQKVSKGL
jgi:hypothetical protein